DSEEIVQETYLALFRHLRLGRPRDNLRGWLFRVAHNLALKRRIYNQGRLDALELDDATVAQQVDPTMNPEQRLASRQRQQHLLTAVRSMPSRDQHCLHLRAEGLRYREIAEVLEISLGAVSISLARSLAKLEQVDRGL